MQNKGNHNSNCICTTAVAKHTPNEWIESRNDSEMKHNSQSTHTLTRRKRHTNALEHLTVKHCSKEHKKKEKGIKNESKYDENTHLMRIPTWTIDKIQSNPFLYDFTPVMPFHPAAK